MTADKLICPWCREGVGTMAAFGVHLRDAGALGRDEAIETGHCARLWDMRNGLSSWTLAAPMTGDVLEALPKALERD